MSNISFNHLKKSQIGETKMEHGHTLELKEETANKPRWHLTGVPIQSHRFSKDTKDRLRFLLKQSYKPEMKVEGDQPLYRLTSKDGATVKISKLEYDFIIDEQKRKPSLVKSLFSLFKSQLGMFGGTTEPPAHKPTQRVPFASQKDKEQHNIGDVKDEGGKKYIFLETTIGKPRWHSHEELAQMEKEGKKIPEIAKNKMPGLGEKKKEEEYKHQLHEEISFKSTRSAVGGRDVPIEGKGKITHLEKDEEGNSLYTITYTNELGKEKTGHIKDSEISKQSEIPSQQLSKPKATAEEQYVQDKMKQGNLEPAIKRQQGIKKIRYTEAQQSKRDELTGLLQRKAQLQREVSSSLEATRKVEKGGQEFDVDRKDYAKREMKQIDKKIGNLKQDLGQLGEDIFKQEEDMFSQAPAKPKDQLSENINKKVIEQGEKEKPTLKQLMTTQAEVLRLAEIPEQDIAMYALNSMADGAKLRSYSTEVMKGEMTAEQAAEKVKGDYKKMVEGDKPQNVGEMPSTKEGESDNLKLFADEAKKYKSADDFENAVYGGEIDLSKFGFKGAKPTKLMPGSIDEYPEGFPKGNDAFAKFYNENVKPKASTEQKEPDKDTFPLLPSEKDSKEGDTKSINGITYELKRGESGELRWHRVTEEEKGLEKLSDKELSEAVDRDWKENVLPHDTGNGSTNDNFSNAIKEHKERMKSHKDLLKKRMSERIKKHQEERDKAYVEAKEKYENKVVTLTSDINMGSAKLKAGQKVSIKNLHFTLGDVHTIGSMGIKAVDDRGRSVEMSLQKLIDNSSLKEKTKDSEPVVMPRQEAIEEHEHLVKVLENGTEAERKAEAKKQAKELEEYKKPESLKEQVEERLTEKQAGKKFKDVGTRVGGSRKEIAAIRVLTADDLSKLDNATAYRVVTKERILPDIDAEAEKANGVESGAAYLKKKLRDAINAKPGNTPEDRKRFIETAPKVFQMINEAKTIEELFNIGREKFDIWHSFRSNKVQAFLKDDKSNDISGLLGKEFCNLLARSSDSAVRHWNDAKLMNPMTEEDSQKIYKQYEEGKRESLKVNKKRMDERTPEQWENDFRQDPATTMSFTRRQLSSLEKENPEKYKEAIEKHKEREYRYNEHSFEVLPYEKWLEGRPQYKPREASWTWADEKDKKVVQRIKDELKIHDNPPLAFIKRTNGREVKDSDITVDAIKNKYGFKSVQLGNYVKDSEAKEHIRHFIESMNDLEDALGIDIKKMNELSGLSIAFGARGGGSLSLAHYEPMAKIINLTKTQGDGTIGHELFHNIDHLLGGMKEGTRNEKVYLSQQGKSNPSKTSEAMQELMKTLKSGNNSVTATFEPGKQKYTYSSIRQMYEDKGYEYTKDYLLKRYGGDPKKLGKSEDYYNYLATLSNKPIEISFSTGNTKYYDGAKSFKSDYWQREVELFARAAESYIQDRVEGKGMYNNYLVGGNNIQRPDMKWQSENLELAYPQGEERIKINEAFDKLIQSAKDELHIGVEKPKEGKRISSEIQMQKSLYNPNFFHTIFRMV
jgi:hypothetical protein